MRELIIEMVGNGAIYIFGWLRFFAIIIFFVVGTLIAIGIVFTPVYIIYNLASDIIKNAIYLRKKKRIDENIREYYRNGRR